VKRQLPCREPERQVFPTPDVPIGMNTQRTTNFVDREIDLSISQDEGRDRIIEKWESDYSLFDDRTHDPTPSVLHVVRRNSRPFSEISQSPGGELDRNSPSFTMRLRAHWAEFCHRVCWASDERI